MKYPDAHIVTSALVHYLLATCDKCTCALRVSLAAMLQELT